jgi:hypothetical protein
MSSEFPDISSYHPDEPLFEKIVSPVVPPSVSPPSVKIQKVVKKVNFDLDPMISSASKSKGSD